ncbi:MAG: hypothetical protein JWM34_521 [Ilumatobacteraceae bacterium]|nr:hypothetical protein [Ilumatobacteraceae bacterium]
MNRISRAAATAFCAGSLALGGLTIGAAGVSHATAPLDTPSARQVFATSAVLTASTPVATVTTLPLLGAPLVVDVTSAPGGTLASIDVSPSTGLTATTDRPGRVRFVNTDGTAKVEVSARGGGQSVDARAGQLSDVAGPGSWSGDVFGTGAATTVNFTTVANADGSPGITGVTSSDSTAQIGTVQTHSHGDSQEADVSIRFTSGIQARTLTIRVSAGNHDGASQARVSVSLGRLTGQALPAADVVGAHTWNGTLCDGTAASIAYTINADGSISGASATPTATIDAQSGQGINVTFADKESVRIRVRASADNATFRVSVDERIRCDAADPAVNTPVSTSIPDDNHGSVPGGDDQGGDNHGGQPGGDDQGGDNHGGHGADDPTSTTTASTTPGSTATTTPSSSTPTTVDDHGGRNGGGGSDGSGNGSGHGNGGSNGGSGS